MESPVEVPDNNVLEGQDEGPANAPNSDSAGTFTWANHVVRDVFIQN
jgi:hypothetical protein